MLVALNEWSDLTQNQTRPRAGNSHTNGGNWAKSNFSEILCLSSLSASLMKIRSKMKSLSSRQHFPHYMSVGGYRASSSHINNPICSQIELVQDFIAVLITCKSDKDSIKN